MDEPLEGIEGVWRFVSTFFLVAEHNSLIEHR